MKSELKENMYIRTKDGIIAKVNYIEDSTISFDKDLYRTYDASIDFLEKDNLERIVKASYNIIDILEVGDYINGERVIYKQYKEYPNPLLDHYVIDTIRCGYRESEIKSIVTKEQFEQMAYRIGEDK